MTPHFWKNPGTNLGTSRVIESHRKSLHTFTFYTSRRIRSGFRARVTLFTSCHRQTDKKFLKRIILQLTFHNSTFRTSCITTVTVTTNNFFTAIAATLSHGSFRHEYFPYIKKNQLSLESSLFDNTFSDVIPLSPSAVVQLLNPKV